ncbi:unnamed protein product [Lota lota]
MRLKDHILERRLLALKEDNVWLRSQQHCLKLHLGLMHLEPSYHTSLAHRHTSKPRPSTARIPSQKLAGAPWP